ncbi:dipeptide tripeptide permease [Lacticaseibacillus pantheris DSM 15945 = JCM 12539 = NBRC 106106]|uniref:Di-/tripeptide transporter n=1 Tax=Lacticaseibacillus pantheris DSM 15945 = JCM 12539 = NBRC 106106 TaxID=1423783 RepID=A0A0R1U4T8_9LACO|nr:peptide MFS transporter [Lacticaseibacillus pantheris]KRL86458.1 dipeptide tripeptide permease [Lacticaseibacillus pantheris DSM 15945 = JCM 12539 = NBRC 106106]
MSKSKRDVDHAFFGQPRGLATLAFTEFWERFSYYGMRAILLYYMIASLEHGGLAMNAVLAASIVSIYGSLVYMSSVLGGFVADRLWGGHRTVFVGGIFIMFGHIALAVPAGVPALIIAIILIVIGTGMLKPNISEMVGGLYGKDDMRRDSGFSLLVMGINLGSFLSPIIVGWLRQEVNYHLGFSIAAFGMFIGLIIYIIDGNKYLNKEDFQAPDPIQPDELRPLLWKVAGLIAVLVIILVAMGVTGTLTGDGVVNLITMIAILIPIWYFVTIIRSKKVTKIERSRVISYIPLFIAAVFFWAIEEQGSTVLALFAQNQTQLTLGSFHIPASWFQSLNPLFIVVYTPFFAWLWVHMGKKQPSSPKKYVYGLIFAGLSYFAMMIPVGLFGTSARVSPLWLVLSWAIVEIAEMLISPVGLSVTTKLAPKAFKSQMMSMWFLADSAAQAINAQVVKLYTVQTEFWYFAGIGIASVVLAVLLLFITPRVERLMAGVN